MEQLVLSTSQIERSIPHGDKLQWIHGSDEFNSCYDGCGNN